MKVRYNMAGKTAVIQVEEVLSVKIGWRLVLRQFPKPCCGSDARIATQTINVKVICGLKTADNFKHDTE